MVRQKHDSGNNRYDKELKTFKVREIGVPIVWITCCDFVPGGIANVFGRQKASYSTPSNLMM